jgi:hypothetical protein
MDKQQILEIAKNDPRFSQAVLTLENQIGDMPITTEGLDEIVQMLEFALNNPDQYQEVLKAAIDDGLLDQGDLPEQFDPVAIISILVLMYGMQERAKQKGFARGGLASIAAKGRYGDTMLAHINPREAAMLKRMGGSGTINPNTGLPEYKFSFKNFLKIALPIAINFIAPGLGATIGANLGFSGVAASAVGGALIGGASSALTGGDPLKGALMGGLGGGLGGMAGGAANKAFDLGLGQTGQNLLGGALVGGAAGAATGQGFAKGALQGAVGSGIGELAGGASGPTAFQQGISAAGRTFGQGLTAGYDPKTAATMGVASGLTTGFTYKPSDAVVDGLKTKEPSFMDKALKGGPLETQAATTTTTPVAKPTGILGSGVTTGQALTGLSLISALQKPPQAAEDAIKKLSPDQQEYFARPSVTWDWNKMQNDANASGMSLDRFMASNWPRITGYASSTPDARQGAYNQPAPIGKARGGALSAIARFAQGAGSGRADTIDAKLSDGEYVIDAETVAMLGDGSNQEGANLLDAMRKNIRSHKGKALAKGKFSPNAKSPLAYLKGVA